MARSFLHLFPLEVYDVNATSIDSVTIFVKVFLHRGFVQFNSLFSSLSITGVKSTNKGNSLTHFFLH